MKQPVIVKSLTTLVELRGRAVDRLTAELAAKESVRDRYRRNLECMAGLVAGGSSQGSLVLALNQADYKQAVMRIADAHRADLALHEADMAVTQRALVAAAQRREALGQVLADRQEQVVEARQKVEQKHQDELASQTWLRNSRT